ncbi:RIP metalloprotease RseP [Prevotella bivia]|uniref:RIP metalloprotease RseP n=1 Tax=Prevotella bivia TaxID=28125 RepID=UPI00254E7DA2|nr:RIP metalloprotease RseP [Prevotella bivia]WIL18089.1 RIP metalloprotease RseP [Prevotella bivia]
MEVFLIKALQLLLALSILVLLHEGGHMFFSKLFGVRVEKFYMFFDVSIGKWSGKLFKFKPKNSDTEYGIGWLPFGGYCKISGMVDESMDTEQLKQDPQPWEFRTKPAWQRLLIMLGGVMVNFFLALFIYTMIMFTWGDTYYKVSDMSMGMRFNEQAKALGFRDKDVLIGTNTGAFREYANMNGDFFRQIAEAKRVDIIRDGKKQSINLPGDLDMLSMIKGRPLFAEPYIPSRIDSVQAGSPAAKAGIHAKDLIVSFNGKPIKTWTDMNYQTTVLNDVMAVKKTHKDSLALRTVEVVVSRGGVAKQLDTLKLVLTPDLKMGVYQANIASYYKPTHETYGFFESIPAGVKHGLKILKGYVGNFKYLASADGAKSLGGFGSIGSLFPSVFDWYLFWNLTAFFSIILAFMNILPIPALDGGHVVFLLYEMITRRKPSEKFLIYAEYIGFGLLILLMVWANLNDILRWIGIM